MSERRAKGALPRGSAACETLSWVAFAMAVWFAAFALGQSAPEPIHLADAPETASEMQRVSVAHAANLADATNGPPVALTTVEMAQVARELAGPPAPVEPTIATTEGTLRRGQTISTALRKQGISGDIIHAISSSMRPVFDFRYAKPGDVFRLGVDDGGDLVSFEYERSKHERYMVSREEGEFVVERFAPKVEIRQAAIQGSVRTSLYDAMASEGERGALAHDFAEIFAWDVDFSRVVKPGDEFSVVYEQRYAVADDGSERYLGPGRILAAQYMNSRAEYNAFYFQPEESRGGYYRADGSSVERNFLAAPLKFRRISSGYSPNRLHPILKVRRPHLGIDYAAPAGTPVWAVADGTVVFRGWQGGFGKSLRIRHANGFVSIYGHLSRFPRGLKVGSKVAQKQVVGYVGSTGLSTGPHLDFRMKKNGKYINPTRVQMPPGSAIGGEHMAAFERTRDGLVRELDTNALRIRTNEAG